MSAEDDLDRVEAENELALYEEYKAVLAMFRYVIETERRLYLANEVTISPHDGPGGLYVDVELKDAWVWDMYRSARFLSSVRIVTFKDVNVETLPEKEL